MSYSDRSQESVEAVALQNAKWTKVYKLSVGDEIAVAAKHTPSASQPPLSRGESFYPALAEGSEALASSEVVGDSDITFEKIVSIEILPAEQVYDIEVQGTHNFVANGIVAHNTYINTSSTTALHVEDSGTHDDVLVADTANGRVGIGTATPLSTLDVRGTIENGLVGWWSMDEGTGTTIADQSINSNTGTLSGGIPDWTNGKFGKGLSFNGSSDYVVVADNTSIDIPTDGGFSVESWIKLTDVTTGRMIVDKRRNGNMEGYVLYVTQTSGILYFRIEDQSDNNVSINGTTDVSDGDWHHIIGVRDFSNTKLRLYVDGVEDNTAVDDTTMGSLDSLSNLFISRNSVASSGFFNGDIDEVRIYNRALSAREVSESYRQKAPSMAQGGTVSDNSAYTALTVQQSGAGDILNISDGTVSVFKISDGGNITASEINNIIYVDGTKYTQDSPGIQEALDDLPSTGGKVILPEGTYNVDRAMDTCFAYDGGSFTDETIVCNDDTANDITLLPATPVVNDAYYFGYDYRTRKVTVNVGTVGTGTYTIIWEYWNGAWTDITPTDGTNGFTTVGTNDITYDLPTDWVKTTVSSTEKYYIRARLDAITSITQPLGTQAYGTGSITIDKSYVTLEGVGDSSKLYLSDGANVTVITVGDDSATFSNISIFNLQIDGNKVGQSLTSHGVHFTKNITKSRVENLYIHDAYSDGIKLGETGSVDYNTIIGNRIYSNGSSGIYNAFSNYIIIENNQINSNSDGIAIYNASNNTIIGNQILSNNNNGLYFKGNGNHVITGNSIRLNKFDGIFLDGSSRNTIESNILKDNSNGNNNTHNEISLENYFSSFYSTYNIVLGNSIQTTDAQYGIYEESSDTDYNNIQNNTIIGTVSGAIYAKGPHTTVAGNKTSSATEGLFDISSNTGATQDNVKITNAGTGNSLSIDQNGAVGTTTTTDGALFLENTGNTGIGLNAYTDIGATADAGLVYLTADNTAFDQTVLTIQQDGTGDIVDFKDGAISVFTITDGGDVTIAGNVTPSSNITYNLGSQVMDTTADVTMTGEVANDKFGYSVSSAGDVNGDGYQDIIIGAENANSWGGRAYIHYGGLTINTIPDITLNGFGWLSYFGYSVSSAGDVNGDGYDDVIVGAYLDGTGGSGAGRIFIYYGGLSMDTTADVVMTGSNYYSIGYSVSSAGDVNGDGYDDVIVGGHQYNSYTGISYIYYGGPSMDNIADVTMTGEATSNYFGSSVSSAGDVNGDGYDDVIVGAYRYNSNLGRSYIYYGGPSMDNIADITMTGEATSNSFGKSVSSAGDINGNGYDDVIIGAEGARKIYIYYGGPSVDNIADVTIEGLENRFGSSVSSAGDVNGDGYSDVIIGAKYASSGGTNRGEAYIYYGDYAMDDIADVTFGGENDSEYFGSSVSLLGDINNNGYQDVIVGAYNYSSSTGRAYIYQGSGNRWKSIFAQNINLNRGLQIDGLTLDRWGLNTNTQFGIYAPNWSIDNQGTASLQDLIVGNNVGIGTTNPTSKLDVSQDSTQSALTVTQSGTGNIVNLVGDSITDGTGIALSLDGLTTGTGFDISSTSIGLTSGKLLSVDWSPTSATTATGDLFNINIGADGTIGNLFNITDNGTSLFSVSETAITSNLPHSFTSAGDVSMAYDLLFTNQTASYIKSNASLYLEAGEIFESNDLTLKTYNEGTVVVDSSVTTGTSALINSDSVTTGTGLAISADGLVTGTGADISSTSIAGGASGISKLLNLSRSGTNANDAHTAYGLYSAVTNENATSGTNIAGYFSASGATTANYGLIVAAGDVGIGVTDPDTKLEVYNDGVQLKLSYDGTNYSTFATGATGDLTINAFGGSIYLGDENLTTTGTLGAGVATLATGSTIGTLTLADGSITDSGGAISFGDENLSTTGTLGSGVATFTSTTTPQVNVKYDASNYLTVAADSTGRITFDATGTGDDVGFVFNDAIYQPVYGTDDGLVLDMDFSEGHYDPTTTTTYDRSRYGNDGTMSGFNGTADSGTTTTLVDSILSATDDQYNGLELYITGGTNAGENQTISDYDGASKTITVDTAFTAAIDNTSTYIVGWGDGKYGSGLQFDGTNDYVDAGNDASLDITDAITVETWVKTTSLGIYNTLVTNRLTSTYGAYSLTTTSADSFNFMIYRNPGGNLPSPAIDNSLIADGNWHNIVGTYDKQKVRIYLDGAEVGSGSSGTADIASPDGNLWIAKYQTGIEYFNGSMDGVKIYNRAISADEVKTHYLRGTETHTDLALDTSTTAGELYGNRIFLTDTGVVTTGTDDSYGQKITVSRTGATGGTINTYGQHIVTTGSGTGNIYGLYSDITAGTGTTGYGLYVDAGTGAGTEYAAAFMGGDVGIGTAAPGSTVPSSWNSDSSSKLLEIRSETTATDAGLFLRRSDDATGLDIWSDNSQGYAYIDNRWDNNNSKIYIRTKTAGTSVNAMTIEGTGLVGIGTTDPTDKLTVRSDSTGAVVALLRFENLGVAAIGTGGTVDFWANRTTSGTTQYTSLESVVTDIGDTTYSGKLNMKVASNGSLVTMIEVGNPNVVINRPLQVNVAGNTGMSYDLNFMNTGLSQITSEGPLMISAGDSNHYENLTLTTGGTGDIVMDIVDSVLGLKVLGSADGGYAMKLSPTGNMDLSQNLAMTGGILTVSELNASDLGTPATSTALSGGSCTDSIPYYYKITALNSNGETTGTAQFTETTGASGTNINTITISWVPVHGATSYKIYRSVDQTWDGVNDYLVDNTSTSAGTSTLVDNCSGDALGTPPDANSTGGRIGINIADATPDARIEVLDADSGNPQMRLAQSDNDDYADFEVNAAGDLTITMSGDDLIIDDNLKVCSGACPSLTMNTAGNLLVENTVYADKFDKCWRDDDADGVSDWITVPGNQKFGTDDFCVMKYEAKCGVADGQTCNDTSDTPASKAENLPWRTTVDQTEAIANCERIGADYHVLTEAEWMTIAYNITQTVINDLDTDTGLQLGNGNSNSGAPYAAVADPIISSCDLTKNLEHADNGWSATCQLQGTSGTTADFGYTHDGSSNFSIAYNSGGDSKAKIRTHVLSNGEIIWDIAGNVWEWTNATSNTDNHPYGDTAISEWLGYFVEDGTGTGAVLNWGVLDDLSEIVGSGQMFAHNPYSAAGAKTLEEIIKPIEYDPYNLDTQLKADDNGIGRIYVDGSDATATRAFRRGGYWNYGSNAGVFTLNLFHAPTDTGASIGFRCAR